MILPRWPAVIGVPRARFGGAPARPHPESGPGVPGMLRGAARGLMATPWFAAGMGFVLAAGLWIYSPHAELRFPSATPAGVPCSQASCPAPAGHGSGSLAATKPGVPIRHPRKSSAGTQLPGTAPGRTAATGLTFTFTVLWQRNGVFGAMISVAGKRAIKHWKLAFQMPADKITYVVGARWVPSKDGSAGVASVLTDPLGQSDDEQGGPNSSGGLRSVTFMIVGTGTAALPTSCVYKGATCAFAAVPPAAGQGQGLGQGFGQGQGQGQRQAEQQN